MCAAHLLDNSTLKLPDVITTTIQVDQAVEYFKQLDDIDPYRLDNMDTYSNLLYVKEHRVELAHLAHRLIFFRQVLSPSFHI